MTAAGAPVADQAVLAVLEPWIRLVEDFGRYAQAVGRELRRLSSGGGNTTEAMTRLAALGREYLQAVAELPAELADRLDRDRARSAAPRRFGRVIE
jgi:hypothetical protein